MTSWPKMAGGTSAISLPSRQQKGRQRKAQNVPPLPWDNTSVAFRKVTHSAAVDISFTKGHTHLQMTLEHMFYVGCIINKRDSDIGWANSNLANICDLEKKVTWNFNLQSWKKYQQDSIVKSAYNYTSKNCGIILDILLRQWIASKSLKICAP